MDQPLINRIVEGALLASPQPLTLVQLKELFPEDEPAPAGSVERALETLREACSERGVELVEVASGFRYQVTAEVHGHISRLWTERKTRYTRATLETLALIAYRQPITRGEIEDVRGVAVNSNITKTLQEREWIRVVGYRDVPGRPAMFATTKGFLDHFNLKSLDELPPLAALRELEPEPELALDEDAEVPAGLQARADLALQAEGEATEPREETSFRSLLAELDDMEQGLKTDFDDLRLAEEEADEADEAADSDSVELDGDQPLH